MQKWIFWFVQMNELCIQWFLRSENWPASHSVVHNVIFQTSFNRADWLSFQSVIVRSFGPSPCNLLLVIYKTIFTTFIFLYFILLLSILLSMKLSSFHWHFFPPRIEESWHRLLHEQNALCVKPHSFTSLTGKNWKKWDTGWLGEQ